MRDARIELDFADDVYSFRLAWGQLLELQEKTGKGPFRVYKDLNSDDWQVEQIANVIRLGLIGAGMPAVEALKKVRAYVELAPPMENLTLARAVLLCGIFGAPEEKVGKDGKDKKEVEGDGMLKAKDLYGTGAVLGFTPQQVNEMTVFQLVAAVEGYADQNRPEGKLSDDEADNLWAFVQALPQD